MLKNIFHIALILSTFLFTDRVFAQSKIAISLETSNEKNTVSYLNKELLHKENLIVKINNQEIFLVRNPIGMFSVGEQEIPEGKNIISTGFIYNSRKIEIGNYTFLSFLSGVRDMGNSQVMSLKIYKQKEYIILDHKNKLEFYTSHPNLMGTCENKENLNPSILKKKISERGYFVKAAPEKPKVRLLFAYTPGAFKKLKQDTSLIKLVSDFQLIALNKSLEISGINGQVSRTCLPFGVGEVKYEHEHVVGAAARIDDGEIDEIHEIRKECEADLVHIYHGGDGGMAIMPKANDPKFAKWAFSASGVSEYLPFQANTFAHEIGHNFGAGHYIKEEDIGQKKLGFHQYSHGSVFKGVSGMQYNSRMTYVKFNPDGDLYEGFSNPDILHDGVPTGVVGVSENAKTIQELFSSVQEYSNNLSEEEVFGSIDIKLSRTYGMKSINVKINFISNGIKPDFEYFRAFKESLSSTTNEVNVNDLLNNSSQTDFSINEPLELNIGFFKESYLYATLTPHVSIKSQKIKIPDFNSLKVSLIPGSKSLSLNILDSNFEIIKVKGPWIQLMKKNIDGTSNFVNLIELDDSGNYVQSNLSPGQYFIQWEVDNYSTNPKKSSVINVL